MIIQKQDILIGVFVLFLVGVLAFVFINNLTPQVVIAEDSTRFIQSEKKEQVLSFSDLNQEDYSSTIIIQDDENRYISPNDPRIKYFKKQ
jgi:hypothetical protein